MHTKHSQYRSTCIAAVSATSFALGMLGWSRPTSFVEAGWAASSTRTASTSEDACAGNAVSCASSTGRLPTSARCSATSTAVSATSAVVLVHASGAGHISAASWHNFVGVRPASSSATSLPSSVSCLCAALPYRVTAASASANRATVSGGMFGSQGKRKGSSDRKAPCFAWGYM